MLPKKQPWATAQDTWASQINPVLANLLVQGQLLKNITLAIGDTLIAHKLGRQPQGYFLVSPQGPAVVFQAAHQANPAVTLTLTSSAELLTSVWVF